MSCGSSFLYLTKKHDDRYLFAFVPARCKSWSCPTCRPIKAKIVRNYILDNFNTEPLFMLTLTFFHSGSVADCWLQLGSRWNRMRTYIAKKYGKFAYLRIVEPHKDGGWPHMHVLIKGHVMKTDVVEKITDWGFGWNMDCRRISVTCASCYLSGYLTKKWPDTAADILRVASKCRIVSVSRGMPAIFTVESEWDVVKYDSPSEHAKFMCNAIIKMLKDRKATVILSRPFSDGFIIESDVNISPWWLEEYFDPYVWEYSKDFEYSYFPYGLQDELIL